MTLLGTLLKNRRSRDAQSAWNFPNLQGPETLIVTSDDFGDAESMALDHVGKRIGGKNLSPHLSWSPPPPETTELVLLVEDLDVPTPKPAVHCLVLVDPSQLDSPCQLPPGALSARRPAAGVRILRSTISRGYHGPEPIKGHGPHRYVFEVFALARPVSGTVDGTAVDRARPRALLAAIDSPVLARGRITGVYER